MAEVTGGTASKIEVLSRSVDERLIAHKELIEAYSQGLTTLQTSLAVFAVLIAIFIFYLGIRVERNAVKAATDESVKQLADAKAEIEHCVSEAKQASEKAIMMVTDLEGHKELALKHLEKIKTAQAEVDDINPKKKFEK